MLLAQVLSVPRFETYFKEEKHHDMGRMQRKADHEKGHVVIFPDLNCIVHIQTQI